MEMKDFVDQQQTFSKEDDSIDDSGESTSEETVIDGEANEKIAFEIPSLPKLTHVSMFLKK